MSKWLIGEKRSINSFQYNRGGSWPVHDGVDHASPIISWWIIVGPLLDRRSDSKGKICRIERYINDGRWADNEAPAGHFRVRYIC